MLIGEYYSQIGDKNRLAIPKKLRDFLSGKVILTRGYERCLILIDSKRWENLLTEINKRPLLSLDVRDTKRFIVGGAQEIEYDSQGRFVLPESLKSFAGIEERVVFLGIGEWVEVWDEGRWKEKLDNLSQNVGDIAERLNGL